MHDQVGRFTQFVKEQFPGSFEGKEVLDVGSGDINGNNASLFTNCTYTGNDVFAAPNVTVVSKTSALEFADESFDTIISTECFEHDPEYEASLKKIVSMLRPGGLFLFTCASTGRPEHGTLRTSPQDSYGTIGNVEGWPEYYKNLTIDDVDAAVGLDATFSNYASYYCTAPFDLYFWGVKKGGPELASVAVYTADNTTLTKSV
jgi:SAM-dependent methyltransferase